MIEYHNTEAVILYANIMQKQIFRMSFGFDLYKYSRLYHLKGLIGSADIFRNI
jgi:hypothetical protein